MAVWEQKAYLIEFAEQYAPIQGRILVLVQMHRSSQSIETSPLEAKGIYHLFLLRKR